jgi:enoyl-CoA hydratase/carnithine racemase
MPAPFRELTLQFFTTELDPDGIAVIKLNRPPANAHHLPMIEELGRIATAVRFDTTVKVAVLGSALDRFFSAGADINAIRSEPAEQLGLLSQTSKEIIMQMRATPKVYLAAINSHCMGGGLELGLACDLRFAADGAYQFGVPEIALGLIPGEGGTQLLGRVLGTSRALDLMLTGRALTPREAKDLGLVDYLVPAGQLWDEVMEYARRLARGPSRAIGFVKIALTEGTQAPLWTAFAFERELQNQLFDTRDCREGVQAFLEKRRPSFGQR